MLDPPSLKDVSKNPTPEDDNQQVRNSWGEAAVQRYEHEVSTDSSRDREESVSEASQSVAAESVVRAISFVTPFSNIPHDGAVETLDFTSTISKTTTPSSTENRFLSRTHALLANSPQNLPQELDPASVPGVVDPILSAEGRFKCPKCPRDFAERGKAR